MLTCSPLKLELIFYIITMSSAIFLMSGSDPYFLILLGPLIIFQKFNRVVFILLALEYLSLSVLVGLFCSQHPCLWNVTGILLTLSCLVMEASVGIGLLVSLVRWGGKTQAVSA